MLTYRVFQLELEISSVTHTETVKVGEKRTCRIEHERVIVRELVLDRGESLPQLPWADDVLVQLSVGQ